MEAIVGSCICKKVQYCISSKTSQWLRCYCSMCRKAIGAEHCTFFAVPIAKVEFKSKETLKVYKSSENTERSFCSNCGCSICVRNDTEKHTIWFSTGCLDTDIPVVDPHQIFTNDKAPHVDILSKAPGTSDISAWVFDSAKDL